MAQPQVRKLDSLISEIGKSVQPQKELIDQNIQRVEESGAAQERGLGARKQRAFGQIAQQAQDQGQSFSGFTPSEQVKYTADTYMPALAELQNTIASTRGQMLGQKADLDRNVFDKAFSAREGDRDFMNQWQKMTKQQKFQASQADKDRAFQAEQAQIERNFQANQNAAQRANALADAAQADGQAKQAVSKINKYFDGRKGSDGNVAPRTFQRGREMWVKEGGTPDEFAQVFYGWINPNHADDYI